MFWNLGLRIAAPFHRLEFPRYAGVFRSRACGAQDERVCPELFGALVGGTRSYWREQVVWWRDTFTWNLATCPSTCSDFFKARRPFSRVGRVVPNAPEWLISACSTKLGGLVIVRPTNGKLPRCFSPGGLIRTQVSPPGGRAPPGTSRQIRPLRSPQVFHWGSFKR